MLEQYLPDLNLGTNPPDTVLEILIQQGLTLLALITVLMFIWTGLRLLMYGSNDDVRRQAVRSLFSIIVGLTIILGSKGLVGYVLNLFGGATGSSVPMF